MFIEQQEQVNDLLNKVRQLDELIHKTGGLPFSVNINVSYGEGKTCSILCEPAGEHGAHIMKIVHGGILVGLRSARDSLVEELRKLGIMLEFPAMQCPPDKTMEGTSQSNGGTPS